MSALRRIAEKPLGGHGDIGQDRLATIALLCLLVALSSCGFQRQSAEQLPEQLRTISLQSDDPYGHLARAVGDQLCYHRFTLLEEPLGKQEEVHTRLQLLSSSENRVALSVFPDGKGAQYQITYRVSAALHLAEYTALSKKVASSTVPLEVTVAHTFFDNPATALAKGSEQEIARHQLYQCAASQLVLKLIATLTQEARVISARPPAIATTPCNHAPHSTRTTG